MRESYACYVRAYTPQPESKLRGAARNNYVTAVTDEKHIYMGSCDKIDWLGELGLLRE